MNNQTNHLTTEQVYELLDVSQNDSAHVHLHKCAECQQEVAEMREALTGFRLATTGLAASHPLPAPRQKLVHRPVFAGMSFQVFAASGATALALIVMSVALFVPHHRAAPVADSDKTTVTATAGEADDDLLDGIAEDLSAGVPPSLAPLEVASPNAAVNQEN